MPGLLGDCFANARNIRNYAKCLPREQESPSTEVFLLPFGEKVRMRGRTMAKQRARELRSNMTDAEALLWVHLRNRQLEGEKFRRQHPIGPFYVDFVSVSSKLIIEVDGGQHVTDREADSKRTEYLTSKGYRVLRFWNDEVLTEIETVLEVILSSLANEEPPSP